MSVSDPEEKAFWLAADADLQRKTMLACWDRAIARGAKVERLRIALPGLTLSVEGIGEQAMRLMTMAFAHRSALDAGAAAPPNAQNWRILDLAQAGIEAGLPPTTHPLGRYGYLQHSRDNSLLIERRNGFATLYEVEARRFTTVIESLAEVDNDVLAKPLLRLLIGLLFKEGATALHAAAVGFGGQGMLVTGSSGAGKSTFSAAALLAGANFVSDDFVLLSREGGTFVAQSLYATVLLGEGALALAPQLREVCRPPRGGMPWQKHLLPVAEAFPEALSSALPITALASVARSPESAARIKPESRAALLRALAPNSILSSPWREAARAAPIFDLVECLPSFRLETGSDLPSIGGLLRDFFAVKAPRIGTP